MHGALARAIVVCLEGVSLNLSSSDLCKLEERFFFGVWKDKFYQFSLPCFVSIILACFFYMENTRCSTRCTKPE
jgi:hypothetical protein